MSLIAIPSVPDVVRVAFGGEALALAASVREALAAPAGAFLADVQLSAGGSGALWEAALVFTSDANEATPIAPFGDLRVHAVQAGTRAELQAGINRAIQDLLLEGITWIPKIVIAGAGGGAVFCALVFGSVGTRPTAPAGPPNVTSGFSAGPFVPLTDNGVDLFIGIPLVHTSQTGRVMVTVNVFGDYSNIAAGPFFSTFRLEARADPGAFPVSGGLQIGVQQLAGVTVPEACEACIVGDGVVPVGVPLTYDARLLLRPQALATALTLTPTQLRITVEDLP